jgi:hypothetical protein
MLTLVPSFLSFAHTITPLQRTLMFLSSIVNCGAMTDSSTDQNLSFLGLPNPNRWLVDFFYWLFRKGWTSVILVALFMFYFLVLLFTLLIVWAANADDDCVRVGGAEFGTLPTRSIFIDAFALSWNTFSTVGYGSTYPALSTEHDHTGDEKCTFISFLTSLEALVGVIYAGFTGAIIFAKVTRISQRARVKFSDPMLIKYGAGVDAELGLDYNVQFSPVKEENKNEEHPNESTNDNTLDKARFQALANAPSKQSPFPVLEFRIANELHNTIGGEIIGSQVNAVVVIESHRASDEVSEDLAKQIKMDRLKRTVKEKHVKKRKGSKQDDVSQMSLNDLSTRSHDSTTSTATEDDTTSSSRTSAYLHGIANRARHFGAKKMKIDEEDSSSQIVPRMVFSPLTLDNTEHPLFKRLWTFRHVLDQDSPLLSAAARQKVLENNGAWPLEWNNQDAIRTAVRFNQIIVSFTGVSNISAASVYKQKVYDYIDFVVGYQFVNPLYRGRTGKLKVDLNIINDVIEQNGGGGEVLNLISS